VSRSEHGQATVDYLVLVALVAAVLGVGAVAMAPGLANAVLVGLRHALCVAGGGECVSAAPQACVVRRDSTDESVTLKAVFVRIGHSAGILREDLSDGSARVTQIDDVAAGGELGVGAKGRVAVGRVDIAAGGGLSVAAAGWLGHTRMFRVRDGRAAEQLIGRLTHHSPATVVVDLPVRLIKGALGLGRHDGVPAPDEVTFAGGGEIVPALGAWSGALRASLGGTWERGTGRRTYFLELDGEAEAQLRAALGAHGAGSVVVGVTFGRDRRPLELAAHLAADGATQAGLAAAGFPTGPAGRLEIDAALDLTLRDNALAARRFVDALRRARPVAVARAGAELSRRLARDGSRDVRVYSSSSTSYGVGGEIGLGAKAGADVSLVHTAAQLRAAWSRPAGGVWEKRVDCVRRDAMA
jgi:hypothetical protein